MRALESQAAFLYGIVSALLHVAICLQGLLLNHPTWSFAESWNNRHETITCAKLLFPAEVKGNFEQARELVRQLGFEGEILWTATRTDADQFDFQVRRPAISISLKPIDAEARFRAASGCQFVGVIKVLHTFTGMQIDDRHHRRDWVLTSLWAYSMDAVAGGLIFMVLSSLYMWFQLPQKRLLAR